MLRVITVIALTVMLAASTVASTEVECTPELTAAMEKFRMEQQHMEDLIKVSTIKNQIGIEPSTVFDLPNHNCHNVPGQAYRVYSKGSCEAVEELKAVSRFEYKLYYRRAATIEKMFKEPFTPGSDGIVQVEFELTENGWKKTKQRERLWMGDPKEESKHKGPPLQ